MTTIPHTETPVHIPTPLRKYTGGQATVTARGETVGDALTALATQYPELQQHLYTDQGILRSFVNVYVNDDDIRYLEHTATPLRENDTLSIVPSIAGGRE
ncbi:MAG: ubiquitin-like small modifier protein 1 [Rhodothermales bacterium]